MLESLDLTGKLFRLVAWKRSEWPRSGPSSLATQRLLLVAHRIAAGPKGGGPVDPCSYQEITVGVRGSSCLFGLIAPVHVSQAHKKSELLDPSALRLVVVVLWITEDGPFNVAVPRTLSIQPATLPQVPALPLA